MQALFNALWTVFFTVGITVIVGLIVSTLNRAFVQLCGRTFGLKAVYATSLLGTPIHELSHAIMCIIFGHKITDMRLLTFDPKFERLGYVRHVYDKNSIYQKIGNFFICVAPVLGGCGIMLAGLALLPCGSGNILSTLPDMQISNVSQFFDCTISSLDTLFKATFSKQVLLSPWWWLYCILACSVAIHINIEPSELRESISGLVTFTAVTIAFHLITALIDGAFYAKVNAAFVRFQTIIILVYCLALLFNLVCTLVATAVYCIRTKFCEWSRIGQQRRMQGE